MMQLVASLGGFLQRKSDKHPGPKPIWIGLQMLADLVLAASSLTTNLWVTIRKTVARSKYPFRTK